MLLVGAPSGGSFPARLPASHHVLLQRVALASPLPEGTYTTKPHLGHMDFPTQGGQVVPQSVSPITKHTLGTKAATLHAREHLLGCEEIQTVFHSGVSSQTSDQLTALLQSTREPHFGGQTRPSPGPPSAASGVATYCLFSEKTLMKDYCSCH